MWNVIYSYFAWKTEGQDECNALWDTKLQTVYFDIVYLSFFAICNLGIMKK